MLSDPLSITINTVASDLNLTQPGENRSVYTSDDGLMKLTISHAESGKKTRRLCRLDVRTVAADPLTAVNAYKDFSTYMVIEEPDFGFTTTEMDNIIQGLFSLLTTALVTEILRGQH